MVDQGHLVVYQNCRCMRKCNCKVVLSYFQRVLCGTFGGPSDGPSIDFEGLKSSIYYNFYHTA